MIKLATIEHATVTAQLALQLWPDNDLEEFIQNMEVTIKHPHSAIFLAFSEEEAIGFAHCQLRHDYVEGTDSSPVGYLEGYMSLSITVSVA